jgi:hypothetical protein
MRHVAHALPLLVVVGCKGNEPTTADSDPPDTDAVDVPPPCASGGWGWIGDPEGAIHVRADGSDDGDGSQEQPVASPSVALALARASGVRRVAIGPGTFATSLDVLADAGSGYSDDGLAIEGCGPDETILEAEDASSYVIRVTDAADVRLAGFSVVGGRRSLWIWGGSSALEALVVADATRVGIMMDGSNNLTEVTAQDVRVEGVSADTDGSFGYGIAVQDATVTLTDTEVSEATGVGVLVDGAFASATLETVTVRDTALDGGGRFGRGVQVQGLSEAALSACELAGNQDAGVFALQAVQLDVSDTVVSGVSASTLPDGTSTGDGIVVSQGSAYEYAASTFLATLSGNSVDLPDRAGIVIAGVSAAVSGNTVTSAGYSPDGFGILSQGPAEITGDVSAVYDLEVVGAPLAMDEDLLTSDDFTD